MKYCLVVLSLTLSLLNGQVSAQHDPNAGSPAAKLTSAEWQADIRYLGDELAKRHRNAFHRLKREDYEAAVKTLHNNAPKMTEDEIIVGMMKIVAMVKDGHTNLIPRSYFRSGVFPVNFYWFSDGLYVTQAAAEHAELVGTKVIRIGKMSAQDALKAVGEINASDNEMGRRSYAPVLLKVPEILSGLRIIDDKAALSLVVEAGGKQRTIDIRPTAPVNTLVRAPKEWVDMGRSSPMPLYRKDPDNAYWSQDLPDKKLVYIQHNSISNKEGETVADFYKRVLASAEAGPVDKIVVDLRSNGGGNNGLNVAVVRQLIRSRFDRKGSLFVIVGRNTFSAAQNLVNALEKYTEAIFVGEPTSAHPNHYGDSRPFELPNSRLTVRASTVWWQDLDPRDDRYWTAPEIAAEMSSEDYRLGRDPAMQAILEYSPAESFAGILSEAQRTGDINTFISKYRAYKNDPKHRFVDTQSAINRAGYWLLERKRINEAIEIFKLNAEYYPNSANVHDSLGDAYQAAGKKEDAIRSYTKAITIDPNYPSSLEALKRLRAN